MQARLCVGLYKQHLFQTKCVESAEILWQTSPTLVATTHRPSRRNLHWTGPDLVDLGGTGTFHTFVILWFFSLKLIVPEPPSPNIILSQPSWSAQANALLPEPGLKVLKHSQGRRGRPIRSPNKLETSRVLSSEELSQAMSKIWQLLFWAPFCGCCVLINLEPSYVGPRL